MRNVVYFPICNIFDTILYILPANANDKFYIYYTNLHSNLDLLKVYPEKYFSKYSDFMVYCGEIGQIVFSHEYRERRY